MTIDSYTKMDHIHSTSIQVHERRIRNYVSKVGRFILHLLEMLLAMMAGMVILYLLDILLIPESSIFTPFVDYGTIQFDFAMAVFMTVPMAAWMIVRGHGWRHGAEMAFAMFAPVATIIVLRLLEADAYPLWLAQASHPAMFLGMILAMLFSRGHYTNKAGHSAHATHH